MGNAVNVMLWGLSWNPGADKEGKDYEMWAQAYTSLAVGHIKTIALRDRPDVIAIYGEFLKATLKTSLLSDYPHFVDEMTGLQTVTTMVQNPKIVGRDSSGTPIDASGNRVSPELVPLTSQSSRSGLVIFSKLALTQLLSGSQSYREFDPASGNSPVTVIGLDEPVRNTRLIFTVRRDDGASHIAGIHAVLQLVSGAGKDPNFPIHTMVFGLLDSPPPTSALAQQYYDAWADDMHEPGGITPLSDPGFTFENAEDGSTARLDRSLAPRGNQSNILRAHQITTPIRDYSQGWSLLAHVQVLQSHCTPNDAIRLSTIQKQNPNDPAVRRSPSFVIQQPILVPDSYVWVFVESPGTYSVFGNNFVEIAAFAVSDLTNPLLPKTGVSLNQIPPTSFPPIDFVNSLNQSGQTYSSHEPFFYRIRSLLPKATNPLFTVVIVKHVGDSIATAIELEPHMLIDPELPAGQKLGDTDACYFRLSAPTLFSGNTYKETLKVNNGGSDLFALQEIQATSLQPVSSAMPLSNSPSFEITVDAPGVRFLRLIRSSNTATKVTISYASIVRYLRLDESLSGFIEEETGIDSFGSEEFKLQLTIDGKYLGEWTWADADNHETWHGLTTAVTQSANAILGRDVRSLAFSKCVEALYWKSDVTFGTEDKHHWEFKGPLESDASEQLFEKEYRATAFSDGLSIFRLKLSKYPLLPI
jgi:hypothetical protein